MDEKPSSSARWARSRHWAKYSAVDACSALNDGKKLKPNFISNACDYLAAPAIALYAEDSAPVFLVPGAEVLMIAERRVGGRRQRAIVIEPRSVEADHLRAHVSIEVSQVGGDAPVGEGPGAGGMGIVVGPHPGVLSV